MIAVGFPSWNGLSATHGFWSTPLDSTTRINHSANLMKPQSRPICLDSGCSQHICCDPSLLQDYCSFETVRNVGTGEGQLSLAIGAGNMMLSPRLTCTDTWLVPDFKFNLVSVSQLDDRGFRIVFHRGEALILNQDQLVVARAVRDKGLYIIPRSATALASSTEDAVPIDFLHRLFGHWGEQGLRKLASDLHWPVSPGPLPFCQTCAIGSMDQRKYRRRKEYATRFLYRLHMDTAVDLEPSFDGERHFVVILDEATRFIVDVLILPSRSATTTALLGTLKHLEKAYADGRGIAFIRCDGAREFRTLSITEYLLSQGIQMEVTPRYAHGTNGLVERCIQTLKNLIRCLLIEAGLTARLWPYALRHAVRIYNVIPRRVLNGKSPYVLRYGEDPPADGWYVFGSVAFAAVPQELRSKLSPKGEKCLYLGEGRTGPILYVFSARKVKHHHARTVRIDDGRFADKAELIEHGIQYDPDESLPGSIQFPYDPNELATEFAVSPPVAASGEDRGTQPQKSQKKRRLNRAPERDISGTKRPRRRGSRKSYVDLPAQVLEQAILPDNVEELLQLEQAKAESLIHERTQALVTYIQNVHGVYDVDDEILNDCVEGVKDAVVCIAATEMQGTNIPIRDPSLEEYSYALVAKESLVSKDETPRHYAAASQLRCWREAMRKELQTLEEKGTYELVKRPPNCKPLRCHWVYVIKRLKDGTIDRYKARLVVDGSGQSQGMDYLQSFAPVGSRIVLRLFLHWAISKKYTIAHWDVSSAFLNGDIDTVVYMRQPPGYNDGSGRVCLLKKALYGLRQSPRLWFHKFSQIISKSIPGLQNSNLDPCLWIHPKVMIFLYVDDLLIAGDPKHVRRVRDALFNEFKMTDEGFPTKFLGISITRTESGIHMSSLPLIRDLISTMELMEAPPRKCPMDPNFYTRTREPSRKLTERGIAKYQAVIGSLLYIATCTRPDVALAVGILSQFMIAPTEYHMTAARRIVCYLKGTANLGLLIEPRAECEMSTLVAASDSLAYDSKKLSSFTDSDYATAFTRRSRTGFCIYWGNTLVSWKSRKQSVVALSTAEAELYALTDGAKELYYGARIANELVHGRPFEDHFSIDVPNLYCDNQSTIRVISNKGDRHDVVKHVDIRQKWLRERHDDRDFNVAYVSTHDNVADVFTKPLPAPAFLKFRTLLGLTSLLPTDNEPTKGSVNTEGPEPKGLIVNPEDHGERRPTSLREDENPRISTPHAFNIGLCNMVWTVPSRR